MVGEGTVGDGPGAIVEHLHFSMLASTVSACVATSILCACTRSSCVNLFQSENLGRCFSGQYILQAVMSSFENH
jgi:hypothetical protein